MQNSGGGLKFVTAAGSYDIVTSQNKYQVGAVVIRADNVSPASIEGGTWQKIAQGRAIIGASTDYPLNSTGGEATHKLTIEEMPEHNHALQGRTGNGAVSTANNRLIIGEVPNATGMLAYEFDCQYTGGSQPHNIMQPYLALNIWQKIAD